jgi:hypothetical protein
MVNLLITSGNIPYVETLHQSINTNTTLFIYDGSNSILDLITSDLENIGFIYSFNGYTYFPFNNLMNKDLNNFNNLNNLESSIDNSLNLISNQFKTTIFNNDFLEFIEEKKKINQNINFDLITSNFSDLKLLEDINLIKTNFNILIRYSTNKDRSFNSESWIQESDNIDIKSLYFNNNINNWNIQNNGKLNNSLSFSILESFFDKSEMIFNHQVRTIYTQKSNIHFLNNQNLEWNNNNPWNNNNFIQLEENIIINGNGFELIFYDDFFPGLFSSSSNNINNAPLLRNIKSRWINKETNLGSGIIKEGQNNQNNFILTENYIRL